jgi:hypothetical protein
MQPSDEVLWKQEGLFEKLDSLESNIQSFPAKPTISNFPSGPPESLTNRLLLLQKLFNCPLTSPPLFLPPLPPLLIGHMRAYIKQLLYIAKQPVVAKRGNLPGERSDWF